MVRIVLVLAAVLLGVAPQDSPRTPAAGAPGSILERVVVIGASVSNGFGLRREAGRNLDFGDVLRGVIAVESSRVEVEASSGFVLSPEKRGTHQVELALRHDPTLVVGIDFLFWFAYGHARSPAQRLERLDLALDLLARFRCPVLVSDLADVRDALGAEIPMLHPGQVPQREVLAKLNERLRAWAAKRDNVVLVPVADYARKAYAEEPIEVRGNRIEEDARTRLLQPDLLHSTVYGSVGLAVLAMDHLERAREDLGPEAFHWDMAAVAEKLLAPAEPAAGEPGAPGDGRD